MLLAIYVIIYLQRVAGKARWRQKYLPNAYDAGYYGVFSMEFHADTGRYYAIYDLGDDLTTELMIAGAATGFMEVGMAMGQTDMIMTLVMSIL